MRLILAGVLLAFFCAPQAMAAIEPAPAGNATPRPSTNATQSGAPASLPDESAQAVSPAGTAPQARDQAGAAGQNQYAASLFSPEDKARGLLAWGRFFGSLYLDDKSLNLMLPGGMRYSPLELAINRFASASALDPGSPAIWRDWADAQLEQIEPGDLEHNSQYAAEASAKLEKAATLDPKDARTWYLWGLALDRQSTYLGLRGDANQSKARLEQATDKFAKAVSLSPECGLYLILHGESLARLAGLQAESKDKKNLLLKAVEAFGNARSAGPREGVAHSLTLSAEAFRQLAALSESEEQRNYLKQLCSIDEELSMAPDFQGSGAWPGSWMADLTRLASASPLEEKIPLLEKVIAVGDANTGQFKQKPDIPAYYSMALANLASLSPEDRQRDLFAKAREVYWAGHTYTEESNRLQSWLETLWQLAEKAPDKKARTVIFAQMRYECDSLVTNPVGPSIWLLRGNVLLLLAMNSDAAEREKLYPLAFEAHHNAFEKRKEGGFLGQDNLDKGLALYAGLARQDSKNPELLRAWARFQLDNLTQPYSAVRNPKEQMAEVYDKLDKAAKLSPNSPAAYLDWGDAMALDKWSSMPSPNDRYRNIQAKYREALKLDPNFQPALEAFSASLRSQLDSCDGCKHPGELAELVSASEKILKTNSDSALAWYNLGLGHSGLAQLAMGSEATAHAGAALDAFGKAATRDGRYAHSAKPWAKALLVLALNSDNANEQKALFDEAAFRYGPPDVNTGELNRGWTNELFNYAERWEESYNDTLYQRIIFECESLSQDQKKAEDHHLWFIWAQSLEARAEHLENAGSKPEALELFEQAAQKMSQASNLAVGDNFSHIIMLWQWGNVLQNKAGLQEGAEREKALQDACAKYAQSVALDEKQQHFDNWINWGWTLFLQYQDMKKAGQPEAELKAKLEDAEAKFTKGMDIYKQFGDPACYGYYLAQILSANGEEARIRTLLERSVACGRMLTGFELENNPNFSAFKNARWFRELAEKLKKKPAVPEAPEAKGK